MIAVIFGGFIFWIAIPFFIIVVSSYIDPWLHLPKFYYGRMNPVIGLLFILVGWLFANWTVRVQFSEKDSTLIDKTRRKESCPAYDVYQNEIRCLVYFRVDKVLPLIGDKK